MRASYSLRKYARPSCYLPVGRYAAPKFCVRTPSHRPPYQLARWSMNLIPSKTLFYVVIKELVRKQKIHPSKSVLSATISSILFVSSNLFLQKTTYHHILSAFNFYIKKLSWICIVSLQIDFHIISRTFKAINVNIHDNHITFLY